MAAIITALSKIDDNNNNNNNAAPAANATNAANNANSGGGGDSEYKTLFSEVICSSDAEVADDMMLYQTELTCDVTLYGPKNLTINDLLQQKYRKTIMLRRAETGSMIGESATESTIEAEVRLSQKSVETLQMSLIKAKNELATIIREKADMLAAVPRPKFKEALAQVLGRNGIMAGCGFPSTANDYSTNKNLFTTMMKNKSTSMTPTLFWTSLCVFNHPVSRDKQEDRYALVTTTTDKNGSFYHSPEEWYNISFIVERISVETKQLSKSNSSLSFSAKEVDKLLAFFKTSHLIRKYFPVTLGSRRIKDNTSTDHQSVTDDRLLCIAGVSNQLNFATGEPRLAKLMSHNIADIITTKQSAQAAITNGSGDGGDNVDGNDLIIDNNDTAAATNSDNDEPWYEDSQQVNTPPACPETLKRLKRKMAENKSPSEEAVEAKKARSKVTLKKKKFTPNLTPTRPTNRKPLKPVNNLFDTDDDEDRCEGAIMDQYRKDNKENYKEDKINELMS